MELEFVLSRLVRYNQKFTITGFVISGHYCTCSLNGIRFAKVQIFIGQDFLEKLLSDNDQKFQCQTLHMS
jgi:hypothetical protein